VKPEHQALIYMGVPMLMYALQGAIVYAQAGRYGMALTMFAYSAANVGLILDVFGI
jgi:hypothetical protein